MRSLRPGHTDTLCRRFGQQRKGHSFWGRYPQRSHITAEMGTVPPVGPSVSQLSPTGVLSQGDSSNHSMLRPTVWMDHVTLILPYTSIARDRCHSGPWSCRTHSGSDKGHRNTTTLQGQECRLMHHVTCYQQQLGSRSSFWRPMGPHAAPDLHPHTPGSPADA